MIGRLKGRLDEILDGGCILDVNGVGYLVSCSRRTLDRLEANATAATVLVETHVRQDAIVLYGFATAAERDAFRRLLAIQQVGPKVALDLLSAFTAESLAAAIRNRDKAALREVPGVGPKLADRLLTELRDWSGGIAPPDGVAHIPPPPTPEGAASDAVSALLNLGFRRPEASAAVTRALARLGDEAQVTALISESLKELAR